MDKAKNILRIKTFHLFNEAVDTFFYKEKTNIINGVSERNLCSRLSHYMESILEKHGLQGYYADSEYNRKQNGEIKTILDQNHVVVSICCDLILHSRGEMVANDNLIAIEMKKSTRPSYEAEQDKQRLRALTKDSYDGIWFPDGVIPPVHVCGYHFGIYMELHIRKRECLLEFYKNGFFEGSRVKEF